MSEERAPYITGGPPARRVTVEMWLGNTHVRAEVVLAASIARATPDGVSHHPYEWPAALAFREAVRLLAERYRVQPVGAGDPLVEHPDPITDEPAFSTSLPGYMDARRAVAAELDARSSAVSQAGPIRAEMRAAFASIGVEPPGTLVAESIYALLTRSEGKCGKFRISQTTPPVIVCVRAAGHEGDCQDADGRFWG